MILESRRLRIIASIRRYLESSFWLALLIQGINGLVLLNAYVTLHGESYLQYNKSFIYGSITATFLIMNLENLILSGITGRSAAILYMGVLGVGICSLIYENLLNFTTPGILSFCCWYLCLRIHLAMVINRRINFLQIFLFGIIAIVSFFFLTLPKLLLLGFILLAILGYGTILDNWKKPDLGLVKTIKKSIFTYMKYLFHTLSGISLAYLDRNLALQFLDKSASEQYLRAVQLCLMAAFLFYPYVYNARNKILSNERAVTAQNILFNFFVNFIVIGLLLLLLSKVMPRTSVGGAYNIPILLLILAAVSFSQLYQIISPVIFVKEKFAIINRITGFSAVTSVLVAVGALWVSRSGFSLAVVYLSGWMMQALGTSRFLLRRHYSRADRGSTC
jgi:hypothetical protein